MISLTPLLRTLTLLLALSAAGRAQFSLTTSFAANNGAAGNIFDISGISSVYIRGFDVNLDPGAWDVQVWSRTILGSYVGFEGDPSAWAIVGEYVGVTSSGANAATALPCDLLVSVPAGSTRAFQVVVSNGSAMNYINGSSVGSIAASDSRILLREGLGVGSPFGTTFGPRVFSGTVRYSTVLAVNPFQTIQSRINIATSGQVILVNSGVYNETIDFLGKNLYLLANGPVTIDGFGAGPVVRLDSGESDAALDGFVIQGGQGGPNEGGGLQVYGATVRLRNLLVRNNAGGNSGTSQAAGAGGIHLDGFGDPIIENCQILLNQGGSGTGNGLGGAGGIWSRRGVVIRDSIIAGNVGGANPGANGTAGAGGAGFGSLGNHLIERCEVRDNIGGPGTFGGSGGLYTRGDSATTMRSLRVHGNVGGDGGAGVAGGGGVTFSNGGSRISDSVIYENTGGNSSSDYGGGGGMMIRGDTGVQVLNVTVADNVRGLGASGVGAGGIFYYECLNSAGSLVNSIVFSNFGAEVREILLPVNAASPSVRHCNIQGGWAPGVNIIDQAPVFTDPVAGDFRLQAASSGIDQGDPAAFGLSAVDLDGGPRVVGPAPDLGADELDSPILPGSNEDLAMETLVNGATSVQASPGDFLEIRAFSPGGTFVGSVPIVLVQPFANGNPPGDLGGSGIPEVKMDLAGLLILFDGAQPAGPFPTTQLPSAGLSFAFQLAFGAGQSFRFQTLALSPSAANGVYAVSGAYDVALP